MGRADVPSAGLEGKATGLSASTARFYGDATGVASLQEVAWIQRVPSGKVSGWGIQIAPVQTPIFF